MITAPSALMISIACAGSTEAPLSSLRSSERMMPSSCDCRSESPASGVPLNDTRQRAEETRLLSLCWTDENEEPEKSQETAEKERNEEESKEE